MNVIFVNRYAWPDHSATSQLLTDLAQSLAAAGHQVTVIASRQLYDNPRADLPPRESDRAVRYLRIRTTHFGRDGLLGRAVDYLSFYLSLPWTLWRSLRRGDVVVAMTDPPVLGGVVGFIAMLRGARCVHWLQDLFPEVAVALGTPRIPWPIGALVGRIRDVALRGAAANVVIGERMAAHLLRRGVPKATLHVIPNWAHEAVIQPLPRADNPIRRQCGLDEKFVVAYSGNLGRAHDAATLFGAARRLRDRADIAFLLIGDGFGMRALREQCARFGLTNIQFLPYQPLDRLSQSLAAADLHLVSLRPELEGLIVPSKFYGIAAAARPVGFIGDRDGELARLIAEHACGFSIAQGDGASLATAIVGMAMSPDRGASCGARARRMLDTRFSRDVAHRQWHDLLLHLGAVAPPATEAPRT